MNAWEDGWMDRWMSMDGCVDGWTTEYSQDPELL